MAQKELSPVPCIAYLGHFQANFNHFKHKIVVNIPVVDNVCNIELQFYIKIVKNITIMVQF